MLGFMYRGRAVQIVPDVRKGKKIYWVKVSGRAIDFLSNPEAAKRFAANFIDVILDEGYSESRQYFSPAQNAKRVAKLAESDH